MNKKTKKTFNLAVVVYHPVSYQTIFYEYLGKSKLINEMIFFLDSLGTTAYFEPEWNTFTYFGNVSFENYKFQFLKNWSPNVIAPIIGRINPAILNILISSKYDAILVTGYSQITTILTIILGKLFGKKILLRAEADLGNTSKLNNSFLKRLFLKLVFSCTDAFMYSCNRNKKYFEFYGALSHQCFPLLSSVDVEGIDKKNNVYGKRLRSGIRNEFKIKKSDIVYIFVGRLTERKRPSDILEAYKKLVENIPKHKHPWLFIVGSGNLEKNLKLFKKTYSLNRIIFFGFKENSETIDLLIASDVFCLTSSYDPSPKSLNEAMTVGLPCIISNGIGTSDDLVENGKSGYVIQTGNIDKYHVAMRNFYNDRYLIKSMGLDAKNTAYSWSPRQNIRGLMDALKYINKKQSL